MLVTLTFLEGKILGCLPLHFQLSPQVLYSSTSHLVFDVKDDLDGKLLILHRSDNG